MHPTKSKDLTALSNTPAYKILKRDAHDYSNRSILLNEIEAGRQFALPIYEKYQRQHKLILDWVSSAGINHYDLFIDYYYRGLSFVELSSKYGTKNTIIKRIVSDLSILNESLLKDDNILIELNKIQ